MVPFGSLLSIRRKAAGYSSARSFFRSQGGQRFFRCTYEQYLNAEAGRSVPGPRLFAKIIDALHLEPHTEESGQLAKAYLCAVLKDEKAAGFMTAALSTGKKRPVTRDALFERAVRQGFAQRKHAVSLKQAVLIRKNRANFWCFTVLLHDSRGMTAEELAATVHIPLKDIKKGLQALAREKLLVRDKNGVWSTPLVNKILMFPREMPKGGYGVADLDKEFEETARKHGKHVMGQAFLVRASQDELKSLGPVLTEGVRGASIFSVYEGKSDTGFFRVRADILKVLPF